MINARTRPVLLAAAILAGVWLLAAFGYQITKNSRMTAEKVRSYTQSVDFTNLTGASRAEAIRKLAAMLNALSPEQRRRARMDRIAAGWFEDMTEDEKGGFIEATMPTGFKQMLASFEQLPEAKRHKAIDDALRRLRETRDKTPEDGESPSDSGTNRPPVLSPELQEKVTKLGLKTYYGESSARTKAEMAPLMEELQRMMESGMMFQGRR